MAIHPALAQSTANLYWIPALVPFRRAGNRDLVPRIPRTMVARKMAAVSTADISTPFRSSILAQHYPRQLNGTGLKSWQASTARGLRPLFAGFPPNGLALDQKWLLTLIRVYTIL